MPISFGCPCGKQFAVKDEFAGRRTKCPGCGAALTVPAPAAEPEELSDEDKAFRALAEAPESDPPPARQYSPPADYDPPAPAAPVAAPIASGKKPKLRKASAEEKAARKHREPRPRDPDRAKKILYMIGGVLMILIGGAVGFFSINEGISVRGGVFGFFLVIGGISTLFQGITGDFNEE